MVAKLAGGPEPWLMEAEDQRQVQVCSVSRVGAWVVMTAGKAMATMAQMVLSTAHRKTMRLEGSCEGSISLE